MDLMFLEQRAVVHVFVKDTPFSAAAVFERQRSDKVWDAFLRTWVAALVGYPAEAHLDYGSQLRSATFMWLLASADIKLREAGVENHNSLGVRERYHSFLHQIFKRVRADPHLITLEVALSLTV